MAIRQFQRSRFGKRATTYHCGVCKRLTRNTGDEGGADLCRQCYDLAGISNEISDNGPLGEGSFTKPATVLALLRELEKLGVDIEAAWGREGSGIEAYVAQVKTGGAR